LKLSKSLALLCMLIMSVYIFNKEELGQRFASSIEEGRMKNVTVSGAEFTPAPTAKAIVEKEIVLTPIPEPSQPAMLISLPDEREEILETTIQGGLSIKNETSYTVDIPSLLHEGRKPRLQPEVPQILIIHTHGSEAYTPAGLDRYEASDECRTGDTEYNVIRIGDELAALFEQAGLKVLHDREIYDHPSYTGSYDRSGAAIEEYLRQYPEIGMVIDLHRDALDSNGVVYKTMAEEDGVCASQIMMLVGSNASGLEHPRWQENLSLALYLQEAVTSKHPTLMRPVSLVRERYNQHLSPGSMILEVGCSGNTLQEALAAIRLFADAAAPALLELVEKPAE